MQKKYNSQLVPFARQLRSEMTKEERHLWYDFLRTYPIRFSRQKVLGKYIADFYSGTYACTARFGVGVDAYIDPADCTVFTVICGEFATSRRADVGIGPYRVGVFRHQRIKCCVFKECSAFGENVRLF